jgi:heat shock protein HslJ
MKRIAIGAALLLAACGPDETISGYADSTATYVLREISGTPFSPRATISFPEEGQIAGNGPCNSFSASQTVPYPWFEIGPIAATRKACAALQEEGTYFAALAAMEFSEVTGDVLILSNSDEETLVFQAE